MSNVNIKGGATHNNSKHLLIASLVIKLIQNLLQYSLKSHGPSPSLFSKTASASAFHILAGYRVSLSLYIQIGTLSKEDTYRSYFIMAIECLYMVHGTQKLHRTLVNRAHFPYRKEF